MLDLNKLKYVISGLILRLQVERKCPSCNSRIETLVDHKGFHELLRCGGCQLLYRWPYESQDEMEKFYQHDYKQSGLTTDLPDNNLLNKLLNSGFVGSSKDFSLIIELIRILTDMKEVRILDFGANWGYGVWQFRKAGYSAIGYELSKPRAEYSNKLKVDVYTDWQDIESKKPFDIVFSSHVLEHTSDPAKALQKKLQVLLPGGWLIALFPNGSEYFKNANPNSFHRLWGKVHPFMLDEKFIKYILPDSVLAIGALVPQDISKLLAWDKKSNWIGTLNTSEMMVLWLNPINSI